MNTRLRLADISAWCLAMGMGALIGQPFLGAAFAAGLLWSSIRTFLRNKETAK